MEVFADRPLEFAGGAMRLAGAFAVLADDPLAWRYQLRGAGLKGGTRRRLLAASPLVCLPMPALAQTVGGLTIDIHSHGGTILGTRGQGGNAAFTPLAEPMRQGGMAVICLAVVSDQPTITLANGRVRPAGARRAGELYAHTDRAFERLHRLVRDQALGIVRDSAGLRAARPEQPSVIVSAEGGDFLEGKPERIDEAYQQWQLRHLQLTHYRPNELGDIQTEPAVHGGLTPAGAEVIPRFNRIGLVVDLAHGTYDPVTHAPPEATQPPLLPPTPLPARPAARTLPVPPAHALPAGLGDGQTSR